MHRERARRHGMRHDQRSRQELPRHRARPLVRAAGIESRAVQGAEHEQQRAGGGRRGDGERSISSSARRPGGARRAHEPHSPEARARHRIASDSPRTAARRSGPHGMAVARGAAVADGKSLSRRASSEPRCRRDRRRRFSRGNQSSIDRYRQHARGPSLRERRRSLFATSIVAAPSPTSTERSSCCRPSSGH